MPMKPVAPTRPMRIREDEEAETKVVEVGAVEVEDEQQVKVTLELEPVEGDGKTETKVDFKLDVEVDPNTPGKEPLTTHLEGQVAHNVLLMHLLTDSPQVEGNEMDVEMEGKTKDDGNVVLEGSVQQGKDQVGKHRQSTLISDYSNNRTATLASWTWWARTRTRPSCVTSPPTTPSTSRGKRGTSSPAVTPSKDSPKYFLFDYSLPVSHFVPNYLLIAIMLSFCVPSSQFEPSELLTLKKVSIP